MIKYHLGYHLFFYLFIKNLLTSCYVVYTIIGIKNE